MKSAKKYARYRMQCSNIVQNERNKEIKKDEEEDICM